MAKNSIDVYGAKGKTNTLFFDPEDLTLVTDPASPLFDERVHWPVNENMVRNIMFQGVLQAIEVSKNPETGDIEVVTGRQRVKAAREANRQLRDQGRPPVHVPASVRKVTAGRRALDLSSAMVSENAIRQEETPLTIAAKMSRQVQMGRSEEEIGILFGCNPQTVRATLSLLDCCDAVQKAVDSGQIKITDARKLAKASPEEQRSKVRDLVAAGAGKTGHARARAQRAVMDSNVPRMRTRSQIAKELGKSDGARADALRWVLGHGDTSTDMHDAHNAAA
ncbi:hypothetical protein G3O00_01520 [Burkholderia sp. Ac-20384]|uniref:ParB/RepB/Spo0J family partition protein n=1 Tax=Burkholderia sp. Ac-20384 TaxID=2703902 RepID=UPI00197EC4DD|nr:ParB/RepB/Spo0J family partition protein [Burkholderia sp. Ac-20384]MBN3822297.1 hypothetical protein [Burkholderia sp. Ac-20384]